MFARTALTASVISALLLLGSCSGDDPGDADEPGPSASEKTNTATEERTDCEAEVTIKGSKVSSGWSGEAFVITENRSGPAQYRTAKGKAKLAVFAEQSEEQPAFVVLGLKGENYTATAGEDTTVEADPDGKSAEVEAEVRGTGGVKPVKLAATFTC